MDNLRSILDTFSEEEKKALHAFVQRQKIRKNRKDLQLLELLQEETIYNGKELLIRLYPKTKNKVAYHALRRRLMQHFIDFITLSRSTDQTIEGTDIMGIISLSHYLFEVNLENIAWKYLKKAQNQAQQNEQYHLLNSIYNLALANTDNEFSPPFEELLELRNQNKILAEQEERAHIANCILKNQLAEAKREGKVLDFDKMMNQILEEWDLTKAVSERPRIRFNLLSIARNAVVAKKDYYNFEFFLRANYDELLKDMMISEKNQSYNQYYRLSLLYMLAHVLYRNKKFKESLSYLEEFKSILDSSTKNSKSYKTSFYSKFILLTAANLAFTEQREKAIQLLENLLKKNKSILSTNDILNTHLNLVFYHFQKSNFKQAHKVLLDFGHSDTWVEKKMGKEWVVRKWLIESVLQFELKNDDIARKIISKIKQKYASLLGQSNYQNSRPFLNLLEEYMRYPQRVTHPDFSEKVDKVITFAESSQQEDLQEMAFYAWLKSKMERREYYETLLEIANKRN
ncbi:hypothetical protein V9L05_16965 [Bernardetia sp. Wsw4-3y2]|uniref:hypothetical protein n=1 Tax=unclassified Bernardetia TaxID=2647129 RepID=UPI0030CB0A7D